MTEIKKSYLMWIGKEHYDTITDWNDEALALGISKRLPNAAMAKALLEPGTVIFVAHDEGEYRECQACFGQIECPECRKQTTRIVNIQKEKIKIKAEINNPRQVRKLDRLSDKITDIRNENCETCKGKGILDAGTGGSVQLGPNSSVDYRSYNYWLHRPNEFEYGSEDIVVDNEEVKPLPDQVTSKKMCQACGGTGRLPEAKIFGIFLPSGIEYISKDGETQEVIQKMVDSGFDIVPPAQLAKEMKRKCGLRKPGGVYVVTDPSKKTEKKLLDIITEMYTQGALDPSQPVDIEGDFARFIKPIPVDVKRFRGIKSWGLLPQAEAEAEDILDALEGDSDPEKGSA